MAKRKKQSSKVQKRKGAKARPKAKKLSNATRGKAVAKGAAARTKPKRAPVKKVARPVAPAVETVAVEVIEQPAPGVTTVTEVEETRQVT
jgi:CelD/BcsL family acetyltransferase involved in cellulose biosynthesis